VLLIFFESTPDRTASLSGRDVHIKVLQTTVEVLYC